MRKNTSQSSARSQAGFTLLFAVLVASLLLGIGATIATITAKSFVFSSLGRDSGIAFYSADTGIECALYLDKVLEVIATSTLSNPPSSGVYCNGEDLAASSNPSQWTVTRVSPTKAITVFHLSQAPYCTDVTITKDSAAPGDGLQATPTFIEARGYNTCDTTNPRRLERGIFSGY